MKRDRRAIVAVSVLRIRGPSEWRTNPCSSSNATSLSVHPPSGPIANTGTVPEDVGTVPEDVGTVPEIVGTVPEDVGTVPGSEG